MDNNIEMAETTSKRDKGFTLVELLIVIVILGILATVTVFAVRGITDKGTKSACDSDKVTLQTAVESYFAQYGTGATGVGAIAQSGWNGTTVPAPFTTPAALVTAVGTTGALVADPSGAALATPVWTAGVTPADTLVKAGFLRSAPKDFFVKSDGTLVIVDSRCGTVGNVGG